ncbi:hypothetical protein GCM10007063_26120 [Lentibacillus kapialis]|uniref:Uncharacterized protein n=1 Tax=Lentibacillus kapialis TaxID=340214 RepID=A0A917PZS3_9BACI|nr:hypothetical protein GCM10007063_26120 [Lentibacillus kapialis]
MVNRSASSIKNPVNCWELFYDLLATTQPETVSVNAKKQRVDKDNQQPSFVWKKVQRPSKARKYVSE